MALSEKIKSTRELLGITQTELAKRANISRISVGNYERGTRIPNIEVILKLAKALHTTPDYLLETSKYFNTDEEINDVYFSFRQNLYFNNCLEEFLEKHGYLIEPSIFIYDSDNERRQQIDDWKIHEKQYYRITHNQKSIIVSPLEASRFEENIMKAIEFEFYKLKSQKPSATE